MPNPMTASDLFNFGVANLRLQSSPSQVELHEMEQDFINVPPPILSCSDVDRLAGLQHEEITESRQHHNTRLQRHE